MNLVVHKSNVKFLGANWLEIFQQEIRNIDPEYEKGMHGVVAAMGTKENVQRPHPAGQSEVQGNASTERAIRDGGAVATRPSAPFTTMACFFGPRMRMPSMSACPPIIVLKQDSFFLAFANFFYLFIYAFTGSLIVTTRPPSGALSIPSVPLWSLIISSQTARPMPLPRSLELPL